MPRPAAAEKKTTTTEIDVEVQAPVQKTKTDWKVLYNSKLAPVKIECREYPPIHYSNVSCHSKLPITAAAMKAHLDAEHGGCYFVTLAAKESPWKGWLELQNMGVELADFRCDVCLHEVPLTSASIAKHMKPHLNGNRRIQRGGTFRIALTMSLDEAISSFEE